MANKLGDWLERARKGGFAIGAFNAANLEVVKGIVMAAGEMQGPVIIEASGGEMEYFGMKNFLAVVRNAAKETGVPIFTNLDHGKEVNLVEEAIEMGFDMVHFDGSDLPWEENVKVAKSLAIKAKERGVLLEIELEKIAGGSQLYSEKAETVQLKGEKTDPERAGWAVGEIGADLLAVSVGNLHGVYETDEGLDLELLGQIRERVGAFLVMHGGSGIAPEQLKEAIGMGIVKVNVNTDLRWAFRETLENILKGSDEVKIYKMMVPVVAAVAKVVEEKMRLFGTVGELEEEDLENRGGQE